MDDKQSEKPPVLGSWKNIYVLLIANLLLFIILFYAFTQYFS